MTERKSAKAYPEDIVSIRARDTSVRVDHHTESNIMKLMKARSSAA